MRARAAWAAILGVWGAGCSLAFGLDGLTGGSSAPPTPDGSTDAVAEATPGSEGGEPLEAASEAADDAPQPDAMEAGTWCSTQGQHLLCADFDEGLATAGWSHIDTSTTPGTLSLGADYVSPPASLSAADPASTGGPYTARVVEELPMVPKSAHIEFDMRVVGSGALAPSSYFELAKLEFDDPNPTGEGIDFGVDGTGPYVLVNVLGADGGQNVQETHFSGITAGQWVHVAIDDVLDTTSGSVKLVLDRDTSMPAVQLTGIQTLSPDTVASRVKLGVWSGGANPAATVEFDDVILDIQ